ncbi:hypothetical protein Caci_6226 [Catenulispora acidiphila DSM 44928]|uniref:Uncharacterized protein n=1 Tax=Catenulispora acidiphila (strain DSM 44928 / JCM 14897 / NBRC 102108 / NRRL B-24433 / ID139908) TaxID=479433 RepID=C7QIK3_CATAD|nr:hypothetical protein [Catenulispora acidiphila]ACU75080.1 hypothetical protein Caci_6226 [Catenulispora acidiphila DSM 44928]
MPKTARRPAVTLLVAALFALTGHAAAAAAGATQQAANLAVASVPCSSCGG